MGMPTVNSVGAVARALAAITPTVGTPHTVDDIDILIVETRDQEATLSTPAGFTELTAVSPQTIAATTRLTVFWRRWNGTDGDPTVADSGNHQIARIISISGVKTSGNPWNTTATGTTDTILDTSVSVAGGTTTVADCLILALVAQSAPDINDDNTEFSGWTNADLANVTERMDNTTGAGAGGAIGMATGEKASAGAFGATTATAATLAARNCAMIALEGVASGQTIAANQAIETDIGQIVTPSKLGHLSQATETDIAQVITPTSSGQLVAVDQAIETDIGQEITPFKLGVVDQAIETDTAQIVTPVSSGQLIAVGQAVETNTAQAITPLVAPRLQSKAFRFVLNTSLGVQSISWAPESLGWKGYTTPKAVLVKATRLTALGWSPNQTNAFGFGAATAPTVRGSAQSVVRGNFSPESHRSLTEKLISLPNHNANTIDVAVELDGMTLNGFDIDITDAPAGAYEIVGVVLAGIDLEEAAVISFAETANTQDVSLPFEADFAFLYWNGATAVDAINSKAACFVGAMDNVGGQFAFTTVSVGQNDKGRIFRTDRVVAVDNFAGNAFSAHSGGFLSSPARMRLIWDENPPTLDKQIIFALVLKGPFRHSITSFTKPTGAAPAVGDVNPGFNYTLAMLFGAQKVVGTASEDHARGGFGVFDTESQHAYSWTDEDGASPASVFAYLSDSFAFAKANNNAATLDAAATATKVGNLLRLTWDPNDAVASQQVAILLGPSSSGIVIVETAQETCEAHDITPIKTASVGQANETDTANAIAPAKSASVDQSVETDTAQPIAHSKTLQLGQAVETDTAQSVTPSKTWSIGQATETDVAQSIIHHKTVQVGQATETDVAQFVTPFGQTIVTVSQAVETDAAHLISSSKTVLLSQAIETNVAQTITHSKAVTVGQAIETDTAQPITQPVGYDLPIHGTIRRVDQMGGTITRVDEMRGTITRID